MEVCGGFKMFARIDGSVMPMSRRNSSNSFGLSCSLKLHMSQVVGNAAGTSELSSGFEYSSVGFASTSSFSILTYECWVVIRDCRLD